jgi:hypothetical protein
MPLKKTQKKKCQPHKTAPLTRSQVMSRVRSRYQARSSSPVEGEKKATGAGVGWREPS